MFTQSQDAFVSIFSVECVLSLVAAHMANEWGDLLLSLNTLRHKGSAERARTDCDFSFGQDDINRTSIVTGNQGETSAFQTSGSKLFREVTLDDETFAAVWCGMNKWDTWQVTDYLSQLWGSSFFFLSLLEEGLHEFQGMTTVQSSTSSAYSSYFLKTLHVIRSCSSTAWIQSHCSAQEAARKFWLKIDSSNMKVWMSFLLFVSRGKRDADEFVFRPLSLPWH